jgi:MinD-like ATPase involved in chromosome partitioning or flagellar assembly
MSNIFISYRSKDSAFVDRLANDLQNAGHEVWLDKLKIVGREPFFEEIKEGIEACTHFVFVVTPDSIDRQSSALNELALAHRLSPRPVLVPVIARATPFDDMPLIIEPGLYQFHDFVNREYDVALARLLAVFDKTDNRPAPRALAIMAVMGTKGGVGKGTFVACSAQIMAESGHDVAIIDFDLEGRGSTLDARRRWQDTLPPVKTVFDHVAPHSQGFENHQGSDDEHLWNVTPNYLKERQLGRIWMLPSARDHDLKSFEVVANVPPPREDRLYSLAKEMVDRVRREQPSVRAILIDCGAGSNQIFSAGFAIADYGYILTQPDASFFGEIPRIKEQHKLRYPATGRERFPRYGIYTVVNFVTSQADIDRVGEHLECQPVLGFVQRNPLMQEYQFKKPVDFDLGFDNVYQNIHQCLNNSIGQQMKLPDEFDLRVKQWWKLFIEGNLVQQTLKSPEFLRRAIVAWSSVIAASVFMMAMLALNIWRKFLSSDHSDAQLDMFLILLSAAGFALCVKYLWLPYWKRRVVLKEIFRLGTQVGPEHRVFLEQLRQRDVNLMRYLVSLVENAQKNQRESRVWRKIE